MNHYPHLLSHCCFETVGFIPVVDSYYCNECNKYCEPIDLTDPDQLTPAQLKEIKQAEQDLREQIQDYERNLL